MAKKKKKSVVSKKKTSGKPHRWTKGQSGNIKGRGKDKELALLRKSRKELFGPHGPQALQTILYLMEYSGDPKIKLDASKYIIDSIYGKIAIPLTGEDGKPIRIDIKHAFLSRIDSLVTKATTDKNS